MPTLKITETLLRKTERPQRGVLLFWDTEIKGFCAHVQKTTTTLYYERSNRRHLIGRYPSVNLPRAREAARELDYKLRRGFAKQLAKSNPKLGELVDQYCARPTLRSKKWKLFIRKAITNDLKWAKRRVDDITAMECRDMHRRLLRRGPTTANSIIRVVGTVWNYARRHDATLPEAPTNGIEWYPEKNTLNAPVRDLIVWREAVETIENPVHRIAYLFALHTGLRRAEVEQLEWSRVTDAVYLPPELNKSGREFWLPLCELHHGLLEPLRGLDDRWVSPANSTSGHVENFKHAEVPGTLHSLRHSFATIGVEAGIPEEVVGRLLNHASRTITGQRYVRPNLDFLRGAMQVIVLEISARLGKHKQKPLLAIAKRIGTY